MYERMSVIGTSTSPLGDLKTMARWEGRYEWPGARVGSAYEPIASDEKKNFSSEHLI